ncbi:MAG: NTPase [Thermoproteaceae archaeon]|nr:NTPase [Thermoproteaceae archaeon]
MKIGVAGMPGVGKTTLVVRVVERAGQRYSVCGFITLEVREGGRRVGFDVIDIATGTRAPFARVGAGSPSVGRYALDLRACEVISGALKRRSCDLLVIDEIGTMEFKCPRFGAELESAVRELPRVLATVHRNYVGVARKLGLDVLWLTRESWNSVFESVLRRLGL